MLEEMLVERNMSIYKCSKLSDIPYTTLLEIVRGKTNLAKCSVEIVYKLAKTLGVSMEELVSDYVQPRIDFEVFKSNVCHLVKNSDLDFVINVLKSDEVRKYWNKKWYAEAFYILAMIDYLSRINEIPLCEKYNDIRSQTLKERLYPRDIIMVSLLDPKSTILEDSLKEAIPEFLRFNIVESEIENVY